MNQEAATKDWYMAIGSLVHMLAGIKPSKGSVNRIRAMVNIWTTADFLRKGNWINTGGCEAPDPEKEWTKCEDKAGAWGSEHLAAGAVVAPPPRVNTGLQVRKHRIGSTNLLPEEQLEKDGEGKLSRLIVRLKGPDRLTVQEHEEAKHFATYDMPHVHTPVPLKSDLTGLTSYADKGLLVLQDGRRIRQSMDLFTKLEDGLEKGDGRSRCLVRSSFHPLDMEDSLWRLSSGPKT